MFRTHPFLLGIVRGIAAFLLLLIGVLSFLWAVFCFCGGPDGNFGSRESIIWGFGFLVFAIVAPGAGVLLVRAALKAPDIDESF